MIVMGRISAPFGVKGWVKVHPYCADPRSLLDFPAWWLGREGQEDWSERPVVQAALHGKALIAWLEGVTKRDQAARLKDLDVAVPRSALSTPQAGEFFLADLLGLEVVNRQGERLGRVAGFLEAGPNLVLRIAAEGCERLIPFAESLVDQVELAAGELHVNWAADY